MNSLYGKMLQSLFILMALAFLPALAGATPYAAYTLSAKELNITMPDGKVIFCWAFADVTPAGTGGRAAGVGGNGVYSIPGPVLEFPEGTVTVTVRNDLSTAFQQPPVSLIIPGLLTTTRPAPTNDTAAPKGLPTTSRVRSFTPEAGGTGTANPLTRTYTFTAKAGTYLYESSTVQQAQLPMGLYGAVIVRPAGFNAAAPTAYDTAQTTYSTAYNFENPPQVISDFDPGLNAALIITPAGPISTLLYKPQYFTINGTSFPQVPDLTATLGQTTLVRLLNAGSRDYTLSFTGQILQVIAEDGQPKRLPVAASSVSLSAGKTVDLFVKPAGTVPGYLPVYDSSLAVTNGTIYKDVPLPPAGITTFLGVYPSGKNCSPAKGKVTPKDSGPITIADALHALRESVGLEPVNANLDVSPVDTATGLPCGKGDGTISTTDALFILRKALGDNPY